MFLHTMVADAYYIDDRTLYFIHVADVGRVYCRQPTLSCVAFGISFKGTLPSRWQWAIYHIIRQNQAAGWFGQIASLFFRNLKSDVYVARLENTNGWLFYLVAVVVWVIVTSASHISIASVPSLGLGMYSDGRCYWLFVWFDCWLLCSPWLCLWLYYPDYGRACLAHNKTHSIRHVRVCVCVYKAGSL